MENLYCGVSEALDTLIVGHSHYDTVNANKSLALEIVIKVELQSSEGTLKDTQAWKFCLFIIKMLLWHVDTLLETHKAQVKTE